jgi:ABC-type uncharacterized transport system auxiliary subunit
MHTFAFRPFRLPLTLTVTLAAVLLLTGCFSRSPLQKQLFALMPAVQLVRGASDTNAIVLRHVTVTVCAPFDTKSFVYRTGPQSFEMDPNAEFMGPPARLLAAAIESGLRQSGVFAQIASPGSALPSARILEVQVTELCADFSNPSEPEAVFSANFLLFDNKKGSSGELLRNIQLTRRVRLKESSAVAVAAALNTALEQILAEVAPKLAIP